MTDLPLTERQKEILRFVKSFIVEHHYPPSYTDIANNFGMQTKGAFDHITACKKKGYITDDSKARTFNFKNCKEFE